MESSGSGKALLVLDFPREVNLFRRVVHDKDEFNKWWTSLGNASDAYMSVFGFQQLKEPNYRRGNYQTAIVRHFVLDFDCQMIQGGSMVEVPPTVVLNEVRRLHNYLLEQDIKHGIWFSGGGFHVWVKLDRVHTIGTYEMSSILKGAGRCLVRSWANELSLQCIDPTVTFDLASLIRVPNSYNVKRGLWSIPLTTEELTTLEWEDIQELAQTHRSGYFSYGSTGCHLDTTISLEDSLYGMLNHDTENIPTLTMNGIAVLPCLQASSCRTGSNPTHDARYHLVAYLAARLRHFRPPQTVNGLAPKHIDQITDFIRTIQWVDFNPEITRNYTKHIVEGPYKHTSCASLFNRGYCVGKCQFWDGTGTIPEPKEVTQ